MITLLAKLLKALNSETNPSQIALAFALAMIVGLTPFWSLHNALVLLIACLVRIHFGSFLLGIAVFGMFAWLLDSLLLYVGETLLLASSLEAFWTTLYQSPFWRVSGFNHTATLGGLVVSLIAFVPMFFLCRLLVIQYRVRLLVWIDKLKITKMLKATKFFSLYQRLAG